MTRFTNLLISIIIIIIIYAMHAMRPKTESIDCSDCITNVIISQHTSHNTTHEAQSYHSLQLISEQILMTALLFITNMSFAYDY